LAIENVRDTETKRVLTLRVRRWHPGFWWEVAKIAWRVIREGPSCR